MMFTLYNYVLSGNCYKVRLLAALLDVQYNTVAVNFHPGGEHRKEPLLSLNPAGTLPIMATPDQTLTETPAMLVWLAQHHDDSNRWWPIDDPTTIATIIQWLGFANRLTSSIGVLRQHTLLNKPADASTTRAAGIAALRELESRLAEQTIRGQKWLTGQSPTVADIACFPYTALSPDAGIEHDDYPAIRSWLHSIRSLDGFITMPGIHELHQLRDPAGASVDTLERGSE
jgi:glutathione S-transferase